MRTMMQHILYLHNSYLLLSQVAKVRSVLLNPPDTTKVLNPAAQYAQAKEVTEN